MNRKRVLVAEDNPGLARVMCFTLQRAGFEVTGCPDGTSAWNCLQQGSFDAVVTDFEMPGKTGAELCRCIRDVPQLEKLSIVMVTGRELELDVCTLKSELSIAAILPKPYSPKKIIQILEGLLAEAPTCPE